MSEDYYIVILNSDGDTRVTAHTKEVLLRRLAENYWDRGVMTEAEWDAADSDTNYWKDKMLIIKGTLAKVTPPGDWRVE